MQHMVFNNSSICYIFFIKFASFKWFLIRCCRWIYSSYMVVNPRCNALFILIPRHIVIIHKFKNQMGMRQSSSLVFNDTYFKLYFVICISFVLNSKVFTAAYILKNNLQFTMKHLANNVSSVECCLAR